MKTGALLALSVLAMLCEGCSNPKYVGTRQVEDSAYAQENPPPPSRTFGVGSTREEVAAILGPPRNLDSYGAREYWRYGPYGLSEVEFVNGRVVGWNNHDGNFPLHYTTSTQSYPSTTGQSHPPAISPALPQSSGTAPPPTRYPIQSYRSPPASYSPTLGIGSTPYTSVSGYYRKDGTYVQPHYRTTPNSTRMDNWSTRGNVNPFTGKKGYSNPF